jgi:hypothetical protein
MKIQNQIKISKSNINFELIFNCPLINVIKKPFRMTTKVEIKFYEQWVTNKEILPKNLWLMVVHGEVV